MRQVPQLGLTLSPALAACRPESLAQVGRALGAAADAWRGIAAGAALTGDGLTSGGWRGAGAAAFVSAAHTQVGFVRQGASVLDELAQAVVSAAGRLDAARRSAEAAVDRGRLLDAEARRLDPTSLGYLASHPGAAPALLIAEADLERLRAEMERVRRALELAESDARSSWVALRAACTAVTARRPVVRERLAAATWDPAASVRFAPIPPSANGASSPMAQLGLPEGGVITGPDGREYALVVQTGISPEGRIVPTTRETPATTAGWYQTAELTGSTEIGPKAGTWQKWAVALAGAAQLELPRGAVFDPGKLSELQLLPGGGAQVPLETDPADPAPRDKYDYERRFGNRRYWSAPEAGLARGGRAVRPDGAAFGVNALAGIALARTLDDDRVARYRIVFEADGQGRRRARMQFFRVMTVPGGATVTVAAGAYVDRSGRLTGVAVKEEDAKVGPVAAAPGR